VNIGISFYSASGLMGVPAEMYRYGTMQFMHIICFIFLVPAVGYLYAPMFHRLRIASSFEVKTSFFDIICIQQIINSSSVHLKRKVSGVEIQRCRPKISVDHSHHANGS